MSDKLTLVDGSAYIFRAFYAIRHLSNSRGLPTNAVYGFVTMLRKLLRERPPQAVAVVFDTKAPTFRHEMYSEYKANRPAPPPELVPQFELVRRAVRAFNLPCLELDGYEADDLIATLARRAQLSGWQVEIVSSDKDLYQVVGDGVLLFDPLKDREIGPQQVKQRFGSVRQAVDVMGLAGDAGDNVPGVPGIGEKTALKLLAQYGSFDNVLSAAGTIKGKLGERLREHEQQARLSRKLVTLDYHVPLDVDLDDLALCEPDQQALHELFSELEFDALLATISDAKSVDQSNYRLILDESQLQQVVEQIRAAGRLSVDTETSSERPMLAKLVGVSLCWEDESAAYLPLAHDSEGSERQLEMQRALEILGPLLRDPALPKVGHNIKYDQIVFANAGIELRGVAGDSMLASYLLAPDKRQHNLSEVAISTLGHRATSYTDVCGKGKAQIPFAAVALDTARDYSCEDAHLSWLLEQQLSERLEQQGLESLYHELEVPLIDVLARMERQGVLLERSILERLSIELAGSLEILRAKIYRSAGAEFNIQSPKQIAPILFEKLGLPVIKKTKTGPSTDVSVLEQLAPLHELPQMLLEYRSMSKLKGTYADALPGLINPHTLRIHTSFNMTSTATGRLSSSDPNLQNIPVRTPEGRRIREAFIAPPGCVLLCADYSQIELRIMARLSGDAGMCDAFERGQDVHRRTAGEIFDKPPDQVSDEERRRAKTINFGIIYGISAFRLGRELGIEVGEAKRFMDRYFERYSGVARYMEQQVEQAREHGYVETLLGRRRALPDINGRDHNMRMFAERVAVNTPIQGTAADIIKRAMLEVDREIGRVQGARMLLQVHDELVFEVPQERADELSQLVVGLMKSASSEVPIEVDVGRGRNWAEAH
ncbi:MAG: DNA polymerase I [Candidatus Alcyoniella australis]|nr:DNA polymerase I [Candidatus Alcyoniella australis]